MDTGPSELAKLISDDQAFRLYMVQKLATLDARLDELERRAAVIESGIDGYKGDKQQIAGAKKLVVGTLAVIAAVYGAIKAVLEVITYVSKP
jgi:hypothetical protein